MEPLAVSVETTTSSDRNPASFSAQPENPPNDGEVFGHTGHVRHASPVLSYRVADLGAAASPDRRFAVESNPGGVWEPIGWCADRATADEIVKLANGSVWAEQVGADRDGGYGSHPRTAIPLSVLESAVEDPSKSDLFANARVVGAAPPADEFQALMETRPHHEPQTVEEDPFLRASIGKAMGRLTDKQREAFLLHAEGYSDREIAAVLGLKSHKSAQVRIANAKARLAEALGHMVGAPDVA